MNKAFLLLFWLLTSALADVTPDQYLASQAKPHFATGHTLPYLTQWGWPLAYPLRIEMGSNWGYALPFNTYNSLDPWVNGVQADLTNPASVGYQIISACSNNPAFSMQVNVDRDIPPFVSSGFWVTNASGLFVDANTNMWEANVYSSVNGSWHSSTNSAFKPVVSPEGPDLDWSNAASYWASPLATLLSNAPISMVLNGGEYGLGVPGFENNAWKFDPRVIAATNGLSWPHYASNRKAHQMNIVTAAIRAAVPTRTNYIFYNTGNEQNRLTALSDWFNVWDRWSWWSSVMNSNTDLPSFENYYKGLGSWTNSGVGFNYDLLTLHLNAVGYNLGIGNTNNYSWVNGGWSNTDTNLFADAKRYTGFLKCLYTSGMLGGVAGYFVFPANGGIFGGPGFDASFPSTTPPSWLSQIQYLGHVHALFSWLESFLRSGELLSGPQVHAMSSDQPAYEFTNTTADATARVMARKLSGQNKWVVTAWAANGPSRNVTVSIPILGSITVNARDSGAVYYAIPGRVTLIDTDGMNPSWGAYQFFTLKRPNFKINGH